ncbi:MAG: hypothetical protein ACLTDV_02680 [Eubacterium sp.]
MPSKTDRTEIREKREQARYVMKLAPLMSRNIGRCASGSRYQFADADAKIADARAELDNGKIRLADGWQQLQNGICQLNEQKESAADAVSRQGYAYRF